MGVAMVTEVDMVMGVAMVDMAAMDGKNNIQEDNKLKKNLSVAASP